jgi:hypothetical protein
MIGPSDSKATLKSPHEREARKYLKQLVEQGKTPAEAISHAWHKFGIDKTILGELVTHAPH